MNIYYALNLSWEFDFFKNDIFNQNMYRKNIKFHLFDNDTEINSNAESNIIVLNRLIKISSIEEMIRKLNPFTIFHLSDEWGMDKDYYDLYKLSGIKLLFHQYGLSKYNFKKNFAFQIPLGYVSGFLQNKSFINIYHSDHIKKHDFAFVGELKNDRQYMLDKFSKNFKNNVIHLIRTNWSNPNNQTIKPYELFDLYKESLFVPIGRGNISLDCFRIYEAIVAGAIPVICGTNEEIQMTFNFHEKIPNIIVADTWDEAVMISQKYYADKEKLNKIISSNYSWFHNQVSYISKKVKLFEELHS